jgi:molecular chaperone HtpG
MKEMAALQPGMNFYGEMPDSYSLIVNVDNPIVKRVIADADQALTDKIKPLFDEIADKNAQISAIDTKDKEKLSDEEYMHIDTLRAEIRSLRESETDLGKEYALTQPTVGQLIDLALLGNGMLKGEQLSNFIDRTLSQFMK